MKKALLEKRLGLRLCLLVLACAGIGAQELEYEFVDEAITKLKDNITIEQFDVLAKDFVEAGEETRTQATIIRRALFYIPNGAKLGSAWRLRAYPLGSTSARTYYEVLVYIKATGEDAYAQFKAAFPDKYKQQGGATVGDLAPYQYYIRVRFVRVY